MLAKSLVLMLLFAIVSSLVTGLYFLIRDRGQGERVVKALTLRVVLSVGLILVLAVGMLTGLWTPPL